MVKSLNPEFKPVLFSTSPRNGWLYGKEPSDTLKDIVTTENLTARLYTTGTSKSRSYTEQEKKPTLCCNFFKPKKRGLGDTLLVNIQEARGPKLQQRRAKDDCKSTKVSAFGRTYGFF